MVSNIDIKKHLIEHSILRFNMRQDFVPYVGATANVDLGTYDFTTTGDILLEFGDLVSEVNPANTNALRIKATSSDVDIVIGDALGFFTVWNVTDARGTDSVFDVNNDGDTNIAGDLTIKGDSLLFGSTINTNNKVMNWVTTNQDEQFDFDDASGTLTWSNPFTVQNKITATDDITMQGHLLTLGDGTANDIVISFEGQTNDATLTFDESDGILIFSRPFKASQLNTSTRVFGSGFGGYIDFLVDSLTISSRPNTPIIFMEGSNEIGRIDTSGNLTVAGTVEGLTLTALATGFSIAGGTSSKTLTVEDTSLINQDLTTDASPLFNVTTTDLIASIATISELRVQDVNDDNYATIVIDEDLTDNDSHFNLVLGDTDRLLTFEGDAIISQDYSIDGAPQFGNLGIGIAPGTRKLLVEQDGNASTGGGTLVNISNLAQSIVEETNTNGIAVGLGFGVSSVTTNVGAAITHTRTSSGSQGTLNFATKSATDNNSNIPIRAKIDQNGIFDVGVKVGMTPLGGIIIKLTNKTGANSVAGKLVRADTTTNDAVKLSEVDGEETIGVFLDGGVSDGSEAWIVVSGIADVAMENNTTATRGNWVRTSITVGEEGYADATNAAPPSPAAFSHFNEIGNCIETVTATGEGTHVLARCVLHFN